MVVPRTAMIMPLLVSPSFMLDVSTAAIVVGGSGFGFSGMGWVGGTSCWVIRVSWLLVLLKVC